LSQAQAADVADSEGPAGPRPRRRRMETIQINGLVDDMNFFGRNSEFRHRLLSPLCIDADAPGQFILTDYTINHSVRGMASKSPAAPFSKLSLQHPLKVSDVSIRIVENAGDSRTVCPLQDLRRNLGEGINHSRAETF